MRQMLLRNAGMRVIFVLIEAEASVHQPRFYAASDVARGRQATA